MTLLSVQNLSIGFKNKSSTFQAVKKVSFDIAPKQTLALVGESGSGKTVTALSILKLLPPSPVCHAQGQIFFAGQDLLALTETQIQQVRGRNISMIFQEPMTALNPLHTVEHQVTETLLRYAGCTKKQARDKAVDLLNLVGLDCIRERLQAYPHQLSGGQRQRVMIAMALALEPKLLIADEPTTALDVTTQAAILKLLHDLQQQLGLAILLITHDLRLVRKMAHHVCIMKEGMIVEQGAVEGIWSMPNHDYTKALLDAEPQPLTQVKPLKSPIVLQAQDLTVRFKEAAPLTFKPPSFFTALEHFGFTLSIGETIGIVGESGSGKTTLAHAILKLIDCEGQLMYESQPLHGLTAKQFRPYRQHLQMVFQDPYGSLNPRFMVQQILQEGLDIHFPKLTPAEKQERIMHVMSDVQLPEKSLIKYPHQFSGGQRQRIALARVLILRPKVIILDEPTSALDRLIQKDILALLTDLQQKYGLSYILISHDLCVVRALAHQVIVLKQGKIVEQGSAKTLFTQPSHSYTQHLFKAAFDLDIA